MLANAGAGITGTSQQELCAQTQNPVQREALGCPPQQPSAPPVAGPEATPPPPAAAVGPQVPDYPALGEQLQRSPEMAGIMTPPQVAGGQAWNQTAPAGAAQGGPGTGITDLLKALYANYAGGGR